MGRNDILLTEFKFYNKEKKIIAKSKLEEIEKRLTSKEVENIYWTNKTFGEHKFGFKFYRTTRTVNNKSKFEIYASLLKFQTKINIKDLNECQYLYKNKYIFKFNRNEGQKNILKNIISNLYSYNKLFKKTIYNSWEELVEELIINNKLKNYFMEMYNGSPKRFYNDVKLLFGEEHIPLDKDGEHKFLKFTTNDTSWRSKDMYYILNVVEKRINNINYRIALVAKPMRYDDKINYKFDIFDEDSSYYTSIDKDRIYFGNNNKYFLDMSIREFSNNKILLNKKVAYLMSNNIKQLLGKKEHVIPANIYNFYRDRVATFDEDESLSYLDEREIKLIEQYIKLISLGKTIKINDTKISNTSIEIEDVNFSMEWDDDFININDKFKNLRQLLGSDVKYNLNLLYEKILHLSAVGILKVDETREDKYKNFEQASFRINDMKISVTKKNNRIKINDIFCRVGDVHFILSRAICFRDVQEYNAYVKNVSHIGIDWKKMISNGIVIELNNPFYDIFQETGQRTFNSASLRFSLSWDAEKRSNVYLVLNKTKYLIKYKGKFKQHFNHPRLHLSLKQMYNYLDECIEGLTDTLIIEIIENAIEEAKIVKARGEALVQETLRIIKAEHTDIEVKGTNLNGYKFKGRQSGTDYFVQGSDLTVYRLDENNSWNRRCIVDDTRKHRIFEDKLANRLINIFNEPQRLKSFL